MYNQNQIREATGIALNAIWRWRQLLEDTDLYQIDDTGHVSYAPAFAVLMFARAGARGKHIPDYLSAGEIADAAQRWLEGEDVQMLGLGELDRAEVLSALELDHAASLEEARREWEAMQ